MKPITIPSHVRFGVFATSQQARIDKARLGHPVMANPVEEVIKRHMPKPEPELYNYPPMNAQFADELVAAMDQRYSTGDLMGSLPKDIRKDYRAELEQLTTQLDEGTFTVPDKVVTAIERAYKTAFWTVNDKYGYSDD